MSTATIRILDASLNRANEGLRVVDDYARMALDDGHLTSLLKSLRHDLAAISDQLPLRERHTARDTQHDVGTQISTPNEMQRKSLVEVCQASCERVKQSLRSLEEYGKLVDPTLAAQIEQIRYRFYTIEAALTLSQQASQWLTDVNLCVLIEGYESAEAFAQLVGQLIDASVGMIQLRDKQLDDQTLLARAELLVELCRKPNNQVLAIINDRADIAAVAQADGVHLGQDDLPVQEARQIVGPNSLIGVSTHSIEQARQAVLDGANYLGAGPTFPSPTKAFESFPGTAFLKDLASEISLPSFAIGGITAENLAEVQATGVERVAVSSAVTAATEPQAAAERLQQMLAAH